MKTPKKRTPNIHPAKRKKPPMQPVVLAEDGCIRFQANRIVEYLLDCGGLSLNDLAVLDFPRSDWEQLAQLIGYSVSGFGDLSYVHKRTVRRADRRAKVLRDRAK